ncbi:sucrose transport protein SUC8-like protein [Tanacetum coccineum]|uniref:Sucrose transport protein SUC8-like protein n=1 Tax=Tanacetum coccineum TaxID=301880 RepID=A0ABQ4WM38_9ASTR
MFVSVLAGPWDHLFRGENLPAFIVGSISAAMSGILAFTMLPSPPSDVVLAKYLLTTNTLQPLFANARGGYGAAAVATIAAAIAAASASRKDKQMAKTDMDVASAATLVEVSISQLREMMKIVGCQVWEYTVSQVFGFIDTPEAFADLKSEELGQKHPVRFTGSVVKIVVIFARKAKTSGLVHYTAYMRDLSAEA